MTIRKISAHSVLQIFILLSMSGCWGAAANAGSRKPVSAPPSVADMVEIKTLDSLSLSPDGRMVAYRQISPSIAANRVLVQYFVVPLDGTASPRPISKISEPIFLPFFDMIENGVTVWASDSRSLFALISSGSQIQVHRIDMDGQDEAITTDDADVLSFSLDSDGHGLSYTVRNSRGEIDRRETEAELDGIALDPSVITEGLPLTRNFVIGSRVTTIRRLPDELADEAFAGPLRTKHIALAGDFPGSTIKHAASEPLPLQPGVAGQSSHFVTSSGVTIYLRAVANGDPGLARYQLSAKISGQIEHSCSASFCHGLGMSFQEVGWDEHRGEVIIRHDAGFARRSSLYAWNPRNGRGRTIIDADGSLDGGAQFVSSPCAYGNDSLVCVDAAPNRPARLVRVDLGSGMLHSLANPNAALASKAMGISQRIEWDDADHRHNSGILVLPDRSAPRLPLVITTSSCRGFLQGGSVPLAPEYVLASRGIAALCVNANNDAAAATGPDGKPMAMALHKAALASYRAIIRQLTNENVIDPARVGIVGHSFGAMVVAYAISHSDLFHAAVIGTGVTTDPNSFFITAPDPTSSRRGVYPAENLPPPDADPNGVWKQESAALNAAAIKAPLLLLPPESEYMMALQLYGSIRDAGGTAKMIIYPGDGHLISRQPRHRYSRETNSLDWLAHWLSEPTAHPENLSNERIVSSTAERALSRRRRSCPTTNTDGFMSGLNPH